MESGMTTIETAKLAEVYLAAEGNVACGGHLVGLRAVANYVTEEAAKVCDRESGYGDQDEYGAGHCRGCEACAEAVRALIEGTK